MKTYSHMRLESLLYLYVYALGLSLWQFLIPKVYKELLVNINNYHNDSDALNRIFHLQVFHRLRHKNHYF